MWDWYNRPGSWRDRANVSASRLVLTMVAAGLAMGVLFYVLYAVAAQVLFSKAPA